MATTTYTPTSWARALLSALGVPVSDTNVSAIVAWEQAEGGNWNNPDKYNPLNTTYAEPGSTATNSAGVRAYTSWSQGLSATVATLEGGAYGGILSALKNGASASEIVGAITSSPWGTKSISLGGTTASSGSSTAPAADTATQAGALDDVGNWLESTAIKAAFMLGAVGLVVLGLVKGTHADDKIRAAATQVAAMTPEGAAVEGGARKGAGGASAALPEAAAL